MAVYKFRVKFNGSLDYGVLNKLLQKTTNAYQELCKRPQFYSFANMTSYEVKKPIGTFAVNENETKVAQPSPATSQQQNNGIPAQQIKAPVRPFMPPAGKGQIPIQQRVPINPRQQPQVKATGNIIKKMR